MPDRPDWYRAPGAPALTLRDGWAWFGAGFQRYLRNTFLMAFWVMAYWT